MSKTTLTLGAFALLGLGSCPLFAQGFLYRVTDLGASPTYPESRAVDINERGEVLALAGWPRQAHVYDPATGQLRSIGAPAGNSRFEGTVINESGQVVGISGTGLYLYTPGQGFVDLGRLTPTRSAAGIVCGLNDRGEACGSARGLAPGPEPFLWTPATGMQAVAPGQTGYLCDLNNQGEAIGKIGNQWGYWLRSSGSSGVFVPLSFEPHLLHADGTVLAGSGGQILIRDRFGQITTVPGPPVQLTSLTVNGYNRAGVIAGNWQYYRQFGSSTIFRTGAFLHVPGRGTVDLNSPTNGLVDPAWEVRGLEAMNELGQIVGYGRPAGAVGIHAIRLDPVSPAATTAPLGQGCRLAGSGTPTLGSSLPVIASRVAFQLGGGTAGSPGALVLGFPAATPMPLPGGCRVYLDTGAPMVSFPLLTDAQGAWNGTIDLTPNPILLGVTLAAQAAVLPPPPALDLTNALLLTVGF